MRIKSLHASFVTQVPDPNGLIITGRDQIFATRMECQATHPVVVPIQRKQAQANAHIPNAYGLVARTRCQEWSLMMTLLVVSAGCLVYRRCGRLRRPGNALYCVLMIA